MKSGICPKCQSQNVYVNNGDVLRQRGEVYGIQLSLDSSLFKLNVYLCENCGYVEIYSDNLSDERKPFSLTMGLRVDEEWKRVNSE